MVPKKGDTVEIRQDHHLYLNGQRLAIPTGRFYPRDHGPAMTGFEVFYGALFPAGTTLNKPTGPLVVQHDYYFALGDHRDNSKDSRYWGFVADTRIRGKAFFIYWTWNRYGRFVDHVRWDRLGKLLPLMPAGRFAVSR
jgi:signal peptidase I